MDLSKLPKRSRDVVIAVLRIESDNIGCCLNWWGEGNGSFTPEEYAQVTADKAAIDELLQELKKLQ